MSHTPHELNEEFPEHASAISALKQKDQHFARLTEEYHNLNRTIHRAETDIEPVEDETLETFKKQRLKLKDEIAAILNKAA